MYAASKCRLILVVLVDYSYAIFGYRCHCAIFSAYCGLYLVLANSNFHVSKFSNSDKDA